MSTFGSNTVLPAGTASAGGDDNSNAHRLYQFPAWVIALLAAFAGLIYLVFGNALAFMVDQWNLPEFSHGYLIPLISAFLIWQQRDALRRLEFKGAWAGLALVVLGVGLDVLGRLSALFTIQLVAFLLVLYGLVLTLTGWSGLRLLKVPLCILVFMVPLPFILLNTLSFSLQLVSSSLGVWLMRLAGVSVFLQGNVIDLGNYKLEVAEACSGLRYLLPLMIVSFLMACFYAAPLWKRAAIFLSSIPITIVMNSLRVASIGIMVDRWGIGLAEGALHEVQGWMMFMLSAGILLLEIVLLSRLGHTKHRFREVFGFDTPPSNPPGSPRTARAAPVPLVAAGVFLFAYGISAMAVPRPAQHIPQRESFAQFPSSISGWLGRRETLERIYADALKLDDYLLADFSRPNATPINVYMAWYDTQAAGDATHSPRGCLPGGGWRIADFRQLAINQVAVDGVPLSVNRAVIEYGEQRELVYYWFQQRGRVITSEYLVKWYLLVDAVTRHRSDGALVRLIVPLSVGTSLPQADRELAGFASVIASTLPRSIPG